MGVTAVFHEAAAELHAEVFSASSDLEPDALSLNPIDLPMALVPDGGRILIGGLKPVGVHTLSVGPAAADVLVEAGGVPWVVDIYQPIADGPPVPSPGRNSCLCFPKSDSGLGARAACVPAPGTIPACGSAQRFPGIRIR